MNPDDYDEDGNNIVPCPICLSNYCPGNQFDAIGNKIGDGECPEEAEYIRYMEAKENSTTAPCPTCFDIHCPGNKFTQKCPKEDTLKKDPYNPYQT